MLENLINAYYEHQKKLSEEVQTVLVPMITDLMKENESIESITFIQFTPYFNDGDTCEFNYQGIQEILVSEESIRPWEAPDEISNVTDKIDKLLCSIPTEILLGMYGDHKEITINKDGRVLVNTYEHD